MLHRNRAKLGWYALQTINGRPVLCDSAVRYGYVDRKTFERNACSNTIGAGYVIERECGAVSGPMLAS